MNAQALSRVSVHPHCPYCEPFHIPLLYASQMCWQTSPNKMPSGKEKCKCKCYSHLLHINSIFLGHRLRIPRTVVCPSLSVSLCKGTPWICTIKTEWKRKLSYTRVCSKGKEAMLCQKNKTCDRVEQALWQELTYIVAILKCVHKFLNTPAIKRWDLCHSFQCLRKPCDFLNQ